MQFIFASLTMNQMWILVCLLSAGTRIILLFVGVTSRAAKRGSFPALDGSPAMNESEASEMIGRIRRITAERFGLKPGQLTHDADLTEGLRIPRGELHTLIEDLEEKLKLPADAQSVGRVRTFTDLVTLFVPARLQDQSRSVNSPAAM